MSFTTSIWRFRRSSRESYGYLFVQAEAGRIVPVSYALLGQSYRHFGYGLWYHEYSDHEVVTTHIKRQGPHKWMHEYYRIVGRWMQWSNKLADIAHELVDSDDVPQAFKDEFDRIERKRRS